MTPINKLDKNENKLKKPNTFSIPNYYKQQTVENNTSPSYSPIEIESSKEDSNIEILSNYYNKTEQENEIKHKNEFSETEETNDHLFNLFSMDIEEEISNNPVKLSQNDIEMISKIDTG
jgi:hypothetical protein